MKLNIVIRIIGIKVWYIQMNSGMKGIRWSKLVRKSYLLAVRKN